MSDEKERDIQQLESYELRVWEDGIRLRLWSDDEGRPVEFDISSDQLTMLALEFKKAEMVNNVE